MMNLKEKVIQINGIEILFKSMLKENIFKIMKVLDFRQENILICVGKINKIK